MNEKVKTQILAGNKFLPGIGIKYLQECHKKEKDHKAKNRLLAYILRKKEKSIREMASFFNSSYSTISGWLIKMVQGGLFGKYDISPLGVPCKLDDLQIIQLRH